MAQPWVKVKWVAGILLVLLAALCGLFVYVFPNSKPPKERELIENFYAHRSAYERLRDMLLADKEVLRVASWGVETTKSGGGKIVPPEGGFPVSRYDEYLGLLRETHGFGAFRGRGDAPDSVSIGVWATGWGGNTRHIHVVWRESRPSNLVTSLDDYYRTAKPRDPAFRYIDSNWYLWADW